MTRKSSYQNVKHGIHTKRFCAFWLGIGALFPVLSTFLNPDFITAYVFKVPAFSGPNLCSYKTIILLHDV